jgi:hypothetical protein
MTGPLIVVELREGYPFYGKNVNVPRPGPSFAPPNSQGYSIIVSHAHREYPGSGFGHKRPVDDGQHYSWQGREIPPTAFEIAVTVGRLTPEERRQLVTRDGQDAAAPNPDAPKGWVILFCSQDPSVWNTDSPDENRFAIPVARAHRQIRYLRLKRMDTGEMQIMPITHAQLTQQPQRLREWEFAWNGSGSESHGGRHLGIAQGVARVAPPPTGPPAKDQPNQGPPAGTSP